MLYTLSLFLGALTTLLYSFLAEKVYWYNVIIVAFLSIIGYIAIAFAFVYIVSLFIDTTKPVSRPSKFHNFVFLMINQFLCQSARVKLEVKNEDIIQKGRQYIIVCDHRSKFDSMLIADYFKKKMQTVFISKPSNLKIPAAGPFIHKCGYMAIDRENPREALKTIINMTEFLKNNPTISCGVFPEGTRNKSGYGLLEFKNGCLKLAQKNHLPILIMTIKNTNQISKNFPFKSTKVILDIVGVIEPDIFSEHNTIYVADIIKNMMLESLNEK